jgi:diguanylate cyclase (GGDEF)-like protein
MDGDTWFAESQVQTADRSRTAYLVHIYPVGPGIGSLFNLADAMVTTLGRGDECEIRVGDLTVSRRHTRIQLDADSFWVHDLNSTNGTLVNGVRVSRHQLADGDHIQVGSHVFRFLEGANVEVSFLEEIHRLAIVDGLTGIHNKSYLLDFLNRELARAQRHERPLSLIIFDLDRFKEINDRLGHWAGDCTLRELVRCLKPSMRKEELFARYGGDEFVLVLPETTLDGAACLADRLRKVIETHPFRFEDNAYQVTISVGVAMMEVGASVSAEDLIRRADEKLYQAKSAGRNCVAR